MAKDIQFAAQLIRGNEYYIEKPIYGERPLSIEDIGAFLGNESPPIKTPIKVKYIGYHSNPGKRDDHVFADDNCYYFTNPVLTHVVDNTVKLFSDSCFMQCLKKSYTIIQWKRNSITDLETIIQKLKILENLGEI